MLRLPIGYDNFYEIIHEKFDFVDKTLLIKDVLDDTNKVAVILRPRRFGKTLNLSMLQCFLASKFHGKSTEGLFKGLKIMDAGEEYLRYQGKYPVIFATFKDVKVDSYELAIQRMKQLFSDLYADHRYLLKSNKLDGFEKDHFQAVLEKKIDEAALHDALKQICKYLTAHHGVEPWLLIDEYDSPIQSAYIHHYYEPLIKLMRGIFGTALKGNVYLKRAIITGILRIAKEDLFSGVNNLEVYSVLRSEYSQYFGFTESEVMNLLIKNQWQEKVEDVRRWYNGYQIGRTTIYNPWSIVNYCKQDAQLAPYWVNTSDNALIKRLLTHGSNDFKSDFELLIADKSVTKPIDENMVFGDLLKNEHAAWSLLLMSGYLKAVSKELIFGDILCQLKIPNLEVAYLYRKIIIEWLSNGYGLGWYNRFLEYLLSGKLDLFEKSLREIMLEIVSSHDVSKQPENFYHGLMLGITASLHHDPNYELSSNKESGYGRYDYLILSKNSERPTLLLEFKRVDAPKNFNQLESKLQKEATTALQQIHTHQYATQTKQRNITNIIYIAIAFCGRELALVSKQHLE